ncbi:MAG: hypothetical protein IJM23_11045 [Lachnospiraceae bacterium]|nr:hypothetical protein [Lachnospiraceae bacterium]
MKVCNKLKIKNVFALFLALLMMVMQGLMLCAPVFAAELVEETEVVTEEAPDPDFHIYLAFGQSNMTGAAPIETIDQDCDDDYLAMCTTSGPKNIFYKEPKVCGNWYKATPPLSAPVVAQLGVADYFGRNILDLEREENPNVKVGIIVVAVPGSGIRMFDKDKWQEYLKSVPAENQRGFTTFLEMYGSNPYQRLIDCAKTAQKDGVIKGIIMHQGESDFGVPGWDDEVEKIYGDIVTDLNLSEDVPLILGEVRRGTNVTDMNLSVAALSSRRENFYAVSTKNLAKVDEAKENLHFTSAEYRVLGNRYAQKMMEALKDSEARQSEGDADPSRYVVKNLTTGRKYHTLADAFSCAAEKKHNKLKLLMDAELTEGTIINKKDVTLDLNGYSIDLKGHNFKNYGKLAIINGSEKQRVHYFAVDDDIWSSAKYLTDRQMEAAIDPDKEDALDVAGTVNKVGSADAKKYVKVKGSILYNGGGCDNMGGAILNSEADGMKGSLIVKNTGFVNCISCNGGVLKNEGDGVKLSKVRAYGCRAVFGSFINNDKDCEIIIDKAKVKFCDSSKSDEAVMNFGSLTENGLKVYD